MFPRLSGTLSFGWDLLSSWQGKIKRFQRIQRFFGFDGEPVHNLEVESLSMSLFNDIEWTKKGVLQKVFADSEKAKNYEKKVTREHGSFFGPGEEDKRYGTHTWRRAECYCWYGGKILSKWTSSIPVPVRRIEASWKGITTAVAASETSDGFQKHAAEAAVAHNLSQPVRWMLGFTPNRGEFAAGNCRAVMCQNITHVEETYSRGKEIEFLNEFEFCLKEDLHVYLKQKSWLGCSTRMRSSETIIRSWSGHGNKKVEKEKFWYCLFMKPIENSNLKDWSCTMRISGQIRLEEEKSICELEMRNRLFQVKSCQRLPSNWRIANTFFRRKRGRARQLRIDGLSVIRQRWVNYWLEFRTYRMK